MRYPNLSTSTTHGSAPLSLQACQWRDRQPPVRVREGDGSYFRKPKGLEEGADPLPPLKRLRPPDREEGEERFPYGLPRGVPDEWGSTRGEEEEGLDLPLPKERETARLEEISEERWTWATTSAKMSSLNRPDEDPGATVRERRWASGTGRVVWERRLSRRLARMKPDPAEAEWA